MNKKVLIGLLSATLMLIMALMTVQASDGSVMIWQIGQFEPSSEGYTTTQQVNEFWQVNMLSHYFFTIDSTTVMQDASSFPRGLGYPGSITIEFNVDKEGFYAFKYARFGSETDNIFLDDLLIATVTGSTDGSGSDFETVLYLSPVGSAHTLKIEVVGGTGDNQTHYFDALALEFVNAITVDQLLETYDPYWVTSRRNSNETIGELSQDCGVLYSSSIFITGTDAESQDINIYFWNLGPGPIFFPEPQFEMSLTPAKKPVAAVLNDLGWGGGGTYPYPQDTDYLGAVELSSIQLWNNRMNVHLKLAVNRGDTFCSLGINIHFRP